MNRAASDRLADIAFGGFVKGAPRLWLRLEGVVLTVGSVIVFADMNVRWWTFPILLFVPDSSASAYLLGTRIGAYFYNAAHATFAPATFVGFGVLTHSHFAVACGAVWLAHIGIDRSLGYGLKYSDSFEHTHLGWIGQSQKLSTEN